MELIITVIQGLTLIVGLPVMAYRMLSGSDAWLYGDE